MNTAIGSPGFDCARTQALTNPLLAENVFNEDTFSVEDMEIIKETNTLAQVIVRTTGIKDKSELGFEVKVTHSKTR